MPDPTEAKRRLLVELINAGGVPEGYEGPLWDTTELQEEFNVEGFMAPFVVVRHKETNVRGTLTFVHSPRVYFDFVPTS